MDIIFLSRRTGATDCSGSLFEVNMNIPERYKKQHEKALRGHSETAAINAKCLDCMCWQREEVRKCTITDCSLYPYRPYK